MDDAGDRKWRDKEDEAKEAADRVTEPEFSRLVDVDQIIAQTRTL